MNFSKIKKVRVVVSLTFLIFILLSFFNFYNLLTEKAIDIISSFQFFPLLISQFNQLNFNILILLILFLLTLIFGRVYCSSICPLGTLQDIIIYFSKRIKKKKLIFSFRKKKIYIRNLILFLSIILLFAGYIVLIGLIEPFSNFGRIINLLFIPVYYQLINLVVFFLTKLNYYAISYVQVFHIDWMAIIYTFLFLIFLIVISYYRGRWFCNYLCPTGALLALVSKYSIFRIKVSEQNCTHCRKCEKVCKAECIDSKTLEIDMSSCVGCFNCFEACPSGGIVFKNSLKKKDDDFQNTRRIFIKNLSSISVFTLPLILTDNSVIKSEYHKAREKPITPPGSRNLDHFNSKCTACYLCVSACPTKVLTPTFNDYGLNGLFQPKMDFTHTYCNYDCNICSMVCPTTAIEPVELEEKRLIQIGKAKFIKEDCIVEFKKTDCGACSEHCPTKAVYMIPYGNNLRLPELNNDLCVGCGACEKACPTKPRKAIFVVANAVHQKAKKPESKKIEDGFDSSKDFPF